MKLPLRQLDKHLNDGPQAEAQGRSLLEAGYTTVMVSGNTMGTVPLAEKSANGTINAPRYIPSGAVNINATPDAARQAVRDLVMQGAKHTGEIGVNPEPRMPQSQRDTLAKVFKLLTAPQRNALLAMPKP